ncbi:alpha beta-hydrolase [Trametes coccinea BRFM310]|uniref:Alpha beta-hydrolase n=1 Tax=Trametes coccinea (strain BRFM310) TaxID=1353009 RepID=A0A1Y2J413_TRAC3|nr:alpha beta-hydrolase [Trametes coccinea BRFM310]
MVNKFPSYDSLRQPSAVEIIPHRPIQPRRLDPLEAPPVSLQNYPALDVPVRGFAPAEGWGVSTHLFPAAFPRCPSDVWVAPPSHETREEQKTRIVATVTRLSALKEAQEAGRDSRPSRGEVLWMVANRYTPKHAPRHFGLTLVLLHGIGCHKETWEPVLERLLALRSSYKVDLPINEIWALECVQHGDSGLLNEAVLGDTFDSAEYARDFTNFLLYYLPREPVGNLPQNLSRLCDAEACSRMGSGIAGRTIVGIGHSVGACSLVCPAVEYPNLFSALIFVESYTVPEFTRHLDAHRNKETLSFRRHWLWNSREEAIRDLTQNPYYREWHPKALEAFVQHALTRTPDGRVRTKTHPVLESTMLFERRVIYETWELLDKIHPSIAMHWVLGGKSARPGSQAIQAQTSFRRAANSTNDYHPELDHMLPQQAPDTLGFDIFRFLVSKYVEPKSKL